MAFDPTLLFKWMDDVSLLGIQLSPEIEKWIDLYIDEEKQHIMNRRIRHCFRHIKRWGHGQATAQMVNELVSLDFKDLIDEYQVKIADLICIQLCIPNPTAPK